MLLLGKLLLSELLLLLKLLLHLLLLHHLLCGGHLLLLKDLLLVEELVCCSLSAFLLCLQIREDAVSLVIVAWSRRPILTALLPLLVNQIDVRVVPITRFELSHFFCKLVVISQDGGGCCPAFFLFFLLLLTEESIEFVFLSRLPVSGPLSPRSLSRSHHGVLLFLLDDHISQLSFVLDSTPEEVASLFLWVEVDPLRISLIFFKSVASGFVQGASPFLTVKVPLRLQLGVIQVLLYG